MLIYKTRVGFRSPELQISGAVRDYNMLLINRTNNLVIKKNIQIQSRKL